MSKPAEVPNDISALSKSWDRRIVSQGKAPTLINVEDLCVRVLDQWLETALNDYYYSCSRL
jgi:hypothetical protein